MKQEIHEEKKNTSGEKLKSVWAIGEEVIEKAETKMLYTAIKNGIKNANKRTFKTAFFKNCFKI